MSTSKRRNITFELPPELFETLTKDAAASQTSSLHLRAREIVIEHLSNSNGNAVSEADEAIERLDSEVAYLQDLVRKLAYSVIVHAARRTSDEANGWIREHMPRNRN